MDTEAVPMTRRHGIDYTGNDSVSTPSAIIDLLPEGCALPCGSLLDLLMKACYFKKWRKGVCHLTRVQL